MPDSETATEPYAAELTALGWQIRQPNGTYYDGVWHARRHVLMACEVLNRGESLPIAHWPDRLVSDLRKRARNA